jgi:menaquinone-specific isochorismate synthase
MTASALQAGRVDRRGASGAVDAGLAIAARSSAVTFIAVPAPITSAAAIVEAFRDQPRVAWSSGELTLVGIGCARELRGAGTERWTEIVRAARAVEIGGAVIAGEPVPVAALGALGTAGALGGARPRFLGGAAFAPGAADRAPWTGFGDAWFVLPRWTYVRDGASAHLVLAVDGRDAADATRWHAELALHHAAFAARAARPQPALIELQRASAAEWRDQVVAITDAIAGGTCSKIVAARTATIALAGAVRAADLLAALDHRHADCVRVLVQPPNAGALVAATPERLVRRDGELVWCDALAGTRSIHPRALPPDPPGNGSHAPGFHPGALPPDPPGHGRDRIVAEARAALLASTKDRREHALVVEAIHAALVECADVETPAEPDLRILRHVVHLHTPFRARLREPHHVLELAARLHPTPAVGGTPREVAIDWIRSHEPVARGWYAAPVGWFDLDGNGELAVAIRSGVLAGNRAHLWAGAGIVAGSDPERELAETELKLRAMLGALGVAAEPAPADGGYRPQGAE